MAVLAVQRENSEQELVTVDRCEITIGRNDVSSGIFNDVELPDRTVSRRHARIVFQGGTYFIEDLGSENHVYVNGRQVRRVPLVHGDVINIGKYEIRFQGDDTGGREPCVVEEGGFDPCMTLNLNYLVLRKLSDLLLTTSSVPEFLDSAMDLIMESVRACAGSLLLLEPDGTVRRVVSRGDQVPASVHLIEEALAAKKPVMAERGVRVGGLTDTTPGPGPSALCAPLIHEGNVLGAVYLEDHPGSRFGEDRLLLLTVIANQVASALEKAALNERLRREVVNRQNLERFVSPRVAERIAEDCAVHGRVAVRTARLTATVLFADIEGFTLLTERLDAEEVAILLTRYFTIMTNVLFRWEGTLDKYLGDGLLAIFGAPFPCEDHAERAVRCAREMIDEQQRLVADLPPGKRFSIRIGVNTGEVLAGYLGAPQRMEYTVLGETVVIAYRLQTLAEPGSIYIGRQTCDLIKDSVPVQYIDRIKTPKGMKEIEVFRVCNSTGR
ncbi:MAG: FHA domain-containing protein [Syntrophobacteraceae bacterium]|nr:FHA domain-containing protein [Syntrophobacteraceae bacterium]